MTLPYYYTHTMHHNYLTLQVQYVPEYTTNALTYKYTDNTLTLSYLTTTLKYPSTALSY